MEIAATLFLKPGRDQSVRRFHPWIFSGGVARLEGNPQDGDWVEVKDHQSQTLALGHYQKGSITVRLLHFGSFLPPRVYEVRLQAAVNLRQWLKNDFTTCFRLVHGEGDGLPGLIIDFYNGVAVMQAHSVGMHRDRHHIAEALQAILGDQLKSIFYKPVLQTAEPEYLLGMAGVPHQVLEHGHTFLVDWEEGQKTGFFLDQRENRKRLGDYAQGRTVLNTFCYTGGFSIYALRSGARLVHSVDASAKAIELTRKNVEINGFDQTVHEGFTADTFDFLKDKKNVYDLIILDPPAFAKHKDSKHQAMKGYQRLNAEAMRMIAPGGIIFTFSCSQVVDRQLFYDTVVSAALQSGREVKVLERLGQPADHPVSVFHPEGEYLKGLVVWVA
ncbi:MAG: class I SAM-dependent rRNA methyltransferase [Cyclobacteriaceae bacterium]|jgi:23S rRNA (cytosine1962-C5)-methyltransferase